MFALPKNVVLKRKICVVVHGYINGFADSVPVLNQGYHGLKDVLDYQGARGDLSVHLRVMYGLQLSPQTF